MAGGKKKRTCKKTQTPVVFGPAQVSCGLGSFDRVLITQAVVPTYSSMRFDVGGLRCRQEF